MRYLLIIVIAFSFISGFCHNHSTYAHFSENDFHGINIESESQAIDCCSAETFLPSALVYLKNEATTQKSFKPLQLYRFFIENREVDIYKKNVLASYVSNNKIVLSHNFRTKNTLKLE